MAIIKKCHKCFNRAIEGTNYCAKHIDAEKKRFAEYRFRKARDEERKKLDSFYNTQAWVNLRNYIRTKFFGMCLVCEARGKEEYTDIVHHVVEVSEDWERRLDESNVVPVCYSCHKKIHDEYNKGEYNKRNMQKMLFALRSEFLSKYGKE